MVLPQREVPVNLSGMFFFLVLADTCFKTVKQRSFPREVQGWGLLALCVDCVCPQPGAQQLSEKEWDSSRVK